MNTSVSGNRLKQAADRGLDFLAASLDDNGRHAQFPNNPQVYHKLPYVFHYGDRRGLALRVLGYVERNLIEPDASFRHAGSNGLKSFGLYMLGWLAWGSAALGRFDLARRFRGDPTPCRHRAIDGEDVLRTA